MSSHNTHTDGLRSHQRREQHRNIQLYGRLMGPTAVQRQQLQRQQHKAQNKHQQNYDRRRERPDDSSFPLEREVLEDDERLLSDPNPKERAEAEEAELSGQIPSELKGDTTSPQEHDTYMGLGRGAPMQKGPIDYGARIDPIEGKHVCLC